MLVEALANWLGQGMERAIDRKRRKPVPQKDVARLEHAYLAFSKIVDELQDRADPPPIIPTKDCQTEWEYWINTQRAFGSKGGAPEKVAWPLIGELIALYEVASYRRASASQSHGPTMRFLRTAMSEVAICAPSEMRSYFQAPTNGSLRKNLVLIRNGYFKFLREELSDLFSEEGH